MKCTKCNNELEHGAAFCPNCGSKVVHRGQVKKVSLKCEHCNGTLIIDSNNDNTVLACPYCGYQSLIVENDAVTIERLKTSAHKEIELEKIRSTDRLYKMADEKQQRQEISSRVEKFKNGKFSKFLIIAFFVCAVFACICFSTGHILSGIFALIQTICFGIAWCMGMNIIKDKKRYIYVLIAIAGIVLVVPTFKSCNSINANKEVKEIKWSVIVLADKIPEPNSKKIDIHSNQEDELWIDVCNTSESEYYEYIAACKKLGYTVGKNESSIGYEAYNGDGYHLNLYHYKSDEEMSIRLETPTEVSDLNWSKHDVSAILPEPKSTIGTFVVENDETNEIIVSKSEIDDFKEYRDACKKKGFTIDSKSESDSYTAYDEDGNKVRISHNVGNSEMTIVFEYPMEFKSIKWPTVGVATLAPIPNSLSGKVVNDYGWTYSVYIENTTMEEYEEYVQKCIDAGFKKDVSNYGDSVWADYSDDIDINVSYEGFNIMYIHVTGSLNKDYSYLTNNPNKEEVSTGNSEETENSKESEVAKDQAKVPHAGSDCRGKDYKDIESDFKNSGFTNISTEILYDIVWGFTDEGEVDKVSIDGKSDFKQGDIFAKNVPVVIVYHMKKADDPNNKQETTEVTKPSRVFYSTNDYETAKKGNTGVFSYKNKSGSYDIYWIVDFDEGYVYNFTQGNGNDVCDKLKIQSGNLNDRITIIWGESNRANPWYLHFKYVNQPVTLIVNDHFGSAIEFTTADLDKALSIRGTKQISEY